MLMPALGAILAVRHWIGEGCQWAFDQFPPTWLNGRVRSVSLPSPEAPIINGTLVYREGRATVPRPVPSCGRDGAAVSARQRRKADHPPAQALGGRRVTPLRV